MHASCVGYKRKDLWDELCSSNFSLPWMIAADFIVVSNQDEKLGGNPININDVDDFNTMISHIGLTDIGFLGSKYTWCNNRLGRSPILERLDWSLLNSM